MKAIRMIVRRLMGIREVKPFDDAEAMRRLQRIEEENKAFEDSVRRYLAARRRREEHQ